MTSESLIKRTFREGFNAHRDTRLDFNAAWRDSKSRLQEAVQPQDVVERIAKAIEEVAVCEKTPEKWSHAELVNPEDCAKAAIAAMRSDEIPVVDEAKGGQLMRAAYYRSDTYLRQEDYEGEKRFGPTQYSPKFSQSACWEAVFKAALDYIRQCEPKREIGEQDDMLIPNLVMLIGRLCYRLKVCPQKTEGNIKIIAKTMDYLKRKGLEKNALRYEESRNKTEIEGEPV